MKSTTMVKFMKKEELVNMIVQIKNFRNPNTGKYHHRYKRTEEHWADKWTRAKFLFKMKNFDFLDPLINEDGGYVRYYGANDEVLDMLKYEFEEE